MNNNFENAKEKWGKTHYVTKVWGLTVELPELPKGVSVAAGDGKTYYIQLTPKSMGNVH